MGDASSIEWTDATYNPLRARHRVTGKVGWICIHKSAGCAHCYSETMNGWRGNGEPFTPSGLRDVEPFLDETILTAPLRWRTPRKVFVCSMTDLFGEWVTDEWIDRIFAVMALTQRHVYQVLTKRPERMLAYATNPSRNWNVVEEMNRLLGPRIPRGVDMGGSSDVPLRNVWLGVSVENQAAADERIPLLLQTPAAVRFLSVEPLLGPVDLSHHLGLSENHDDLAGLLHWCIVGGESGPGARPCDLAWIRSVVAQAKAAGAPCFVKQMGARPYDSLFSRRAYGHPHNPERLGAMTLRDRKGGDPAEWPEDLRVREFPR